MKSLEELKAVRDRVKGSVHLRQDNSHKTHVVVGMATCGIAAGARPVLAAFVEEIEKAQKSHSQPKTYRGKQSIKHLVSQNAAISNIEVTDGNIKAFEHTANKYGIDYALKKDTSEQPPRYLVFFKGRAFITEYRTFLGNARTNKGCSCKSHREVRFSVEGSTTKNLK